MRDYIIRYFPQATLSFLDSHLREDDAMMTRSSGFETVALACAWAYPDRF
jgi:hypothetical protein